ncbi:MAG: class I SAM-dependent methyltransferase [Thermoguttaceae bacterium]
MPLQYDSCERLRVTLWLVLAALLASLGISPALVQAAAPPAVYMGRQIATTMHYTGAPWLVRDSRQREEDCRRLLEELRVRPGQVVCDMGCGNGFYTLELARLTGPDGKVYAVDIQSEMLELLQARARQQGIANIRPVLGTETDPRLPERSIDLVLLVDVYHEFSEPGKMLQALRRSLKPGGRIAVAEFRGEDPAVPIQPLHKMTKKQILRELEANGLRLVGQFDGLPWQHLMFFSAEDPDPASSDNPSVRAPSS